MAMGAMSAAVCHVLLESQIGFSIPLSLLLAAIVGGLFSLIHAFASITLRADQIISGTGINLLSNGVTVFVCQLLFRMDRSQNYRMGMRSGLFGIYPTVWIALAILALSWINLLANGVTVFVCQLLFRMDRSQNYRMGMRSSLFGIYPTVWIALAILALSWFMLYKRPWGLRLRAAGEHPHALASAGVNVIKIRYIAVIISGLLAGLAGGCIVLTQDIQFTVSTINGKGFIALAAVSFGRWLPLGVLGSSFLFGVSSALAVNIININSLQFLPSEFFSALPYLITLITLVLFSGKEYAPQAIGKPYDKGKS